MKTILISLNFVFAFLLLPQISLAEDCDFGLKKDIDYREVKINKEMFKRENGKVNFIKFFHYQCLYCSKLEEDTEKLINKKELKNILNVNKIHYIFDHDTEVLSRIYYSVKSLGVWNESLHTKLYKAGLVGFFNAESKAIYNDDKKFEFFFNENKISPKLVKEKMYSDEINEKIKELYVLKENYAVPATPTYYIDNFYIINKSDKKEFMGNIESAIKMKSCLNKKNNL